MSMENIHSDFYEHSITSDLEERNDFGAGLVPPSSPLGTGNSHSVEGQNMSETKQPNIQSRTSAAASLSIPCEQQRPPLTEVYSAPSAIPHREATTANTAKPVRPSLPLERFRSSVRKVIHLSRGSTIMSVGGAGAEPGIDPRRSSAILNYGHIHETCTIDVIDYSALRTSFQRMQNKEFVELMDNTDPTKRDPWVKVRWINIGGISWDVMSAVALTYNLHPLAVEDVVHQRQKARSKADYYPQHLFIRLLRHTVSPTDEEDFLSDLGSITSLPRSSSPENIREGENSWGESDEDNTLAGSRFSTKKKIGVPGRDPEKGKVDHSRGRSLTSRSLLRRRRIEDAHLVQHLKRGERVNVEVQPLCIFLLRDGTVISINKSPDLDFTVPIIARLRQRDTSLRTTPDASLLVQSLLDLVVDQAMEVVDEYQHKILKLEHDVLIKPSVETVRYLHTMSGDLTLHKRTLAPIKTLLYGLRRYDVDRYAALNDSQDAISTKFDGFMSNKSKIYLADVYDHIEYIISSLDMFENTAENLINYTFNMAQYEMNNVMRRLTTATIIFLPLTLLTGYFGMNFSSMWSTGDHSDLFFWEIALPVMAVLIPIFMWSDIRQGTNNLKKRWMDRRLRKILRDGRLPTRR